MTAVMGASVRITLGAQTHDRRPVRKQKKKMHWGLVLTFCPRTGEKCCFRQKDRHVFVKASTKSSLVKDLVEKKRPLLINVHQAYHKALFVVTLANSTKHSWEDLFTASTQTSLCQTYTLFSGHLQNATNTTSFMLWHHFSIHDIHTEHAESMFQFSPSVCHFALRCSRSRVSRRSFVLSHQQQVDFLLGGLWPASVLSVSPVWNTSKNKTPLTPFTLCGIWMNNVSYSRKGLNDKAGQ